MSELNRAVLLAFCARSPREGMQLLSSSSCPRPTRELKPLAVSSQGYRATAAGPESQRQLVCIFQEGQQVEQEQECGCSRPWWRRRGERVHRGCRRGSIRRAWNGSVRHKRITSCCHALAAAVAPRAVSDCGLVYALLSAASRVALRTSAH